MMPMFQKLWGVIDQDLDAGTYRVLINNYYDVSGWDGTKTLVFTTANPLGGTDVWLGTIFVIAGGLSLFGAALLSVKKVLWPPKNFCLEELKWE